MSYDLTNVENTFRLLPVGKGKERAYAILSIAARGACLEVPDDEAGVPIVSLELSEVCETVEVLVLHKNLRKLQLADRCFPHLKEIRIEAGSPFRTDGTNIFQGEEILNTFIGDPKGSFDAREIPSMEGEGIRGSGKGKKVIRGIITCRGDVLLSLDKPVYELILPKEIRKVEAEAFSYHCPRRILCYELPEILPGSSLTPPWMGEVQELVLLGREQQAPLERFRSWWGIRRLVMREDTVGGEEKGVGKGMGEATGRYQVLEGVLFSGDGKTLLWWPPNKETEDYAVPEGVERIEKKAFEKAHILKRVRMPDSVCQLGTDAFCGCSALTEVWLSSCIQVLPGSGEIGRYHLKRGLFACCENLRLVHLPEGLTSIGDHAFLDCTSLESVDLPGERLREVGIGAFSTPSLRRITLPASLQKVGERALAYCDDVWAYEGTAKGLVRAMGSDGGRIHLLSNAASDGGQTYLRVPYTGRFRESAELLSAVWDNGRIDYEAYGRLLQSPLPQKEDKVEIALLILLQVEGKKAKQYRKYRDGQEKEALELLIDLEEAGLLSRYLNTYQVGDRLLDELLEKCNREGRVRFAAILLAAKEKRGKGRAKFEL